MITIRRSAERGHVNIGWLDSFHTFSFGQYIDRNHMGFGPLRVINEDRVEPGQGFPTHGHDNMEIVTWVLEGALEHKDSLGTGSVIRPGEVQRMSAGTGIRHSEYNASDSDPVHLLQIWILPDARDIAPGYEQIEIPAEEMKGALRLIASKDGRDGSVSMNASTDLYAARLADGETVRHQLGDGHKGWVQLARGTIMLNGERLAAGDGAAIEGEAVLEITATKSAEILLFDMAS